MAFDLKTTGMPYYDKLLLAKDDLKVVREALYRCRWRLEIVCPKEYINCVSTFHGLDMKSIKDSRCGGKIKSYADAMAQGDMFPVLVLDYSFKDRMAQEGLHRAFAASLAGIDRVPVLFVESLS